MKRALRQHLHLAVPNVLSNLTVPLAGLVDTVLLGHQETADPLSGVALAGAIFSFLYWGFAFLRMSTTGLTSNSVGADEEEETSALFFRSFLLGVGLGLLILLCRPIIEWVSFQLLQGSPEVEAQGALYFRARVLGAPAVLGLMAINGWLLGRLLSRHVLLLSVVQNFLIVALDYLFIWRLGWGAEGAGYATAASDILSFLFGLFLVLQSWGRLPRFSWPSLANPEKLASLMSLNGQIFVRSFFLILTVTSFTNISAWLGEEVVAANAVLLQLLLFCAYFVDGYAYALESLAGKAAGAQRWGEVTTQLRVALGTTTITTLLFAAGFTLFAKSLLTRMTAHQNINELAFHLLPYFLAALVAGSYAYLYDGLCIGLTRGADMRTSVLTGTLLGFLPFALWSIASRSPERLWMGYFAFVALRAVVQAYLGEGFVRRKVMEQQCSVT